MNRKILSMVCAGAIIASITTGTVFAASTDDAVKDEKKSQRSAIHQMNFKFEMTEEQKAERQAKQLESIKAKLTELVSAGTITQADADAALEILNSSDGKIDYNVLPEAVKTALAPQGDKKGRKDAKSEVTDEQKAEHQAKQLESIKAKLAELVLAGTITQADADVALETLNASDGKIDYNALPEAVKTALAPQGDKRGHKGVKPEMTKEHLAEKSVE